MPGNDSSACTFRAVAHVMPRGLHANLARIPDNRSRELLTPKRTLDPLRETSAAAGLCSSGGRSEPGVSSRSRKSAGAIPSAAEAAQRRRRLAASSVCAIRNLRIVAAGACRDGGRSEYVLLAAGAAGFERRPISRRAACAPKRSVRRREPAAGRGQASGGGVRVSWASRSWCCR